MSDCVCECGQRMHDNCDCERREWEREEMERERHEEEMRELERREIDEYFRRHPHG